MTLSGMAKEFLQYILDEYKPVGFLALSEEKLPEEYKTYIFGLAEELEENGLIKNLRKYGQPGSRGIDFLFLPKGISYFADNDKEQITSPITINGPVSIGTGDAIGGNEATIDIQYEGKKSWFERNGIKILVALIGAAAPIIAAVIITRCDSPSPMPISETNTKTVQTTAPPINIEIATTVVPERSEETEEATITPTPYTCKFINTPIEIGVYDLGEDFRYEDVFSRLKILGVNPTRISPDSNYLDLVEYDVIYLPPGWAVINQTLELHPKFLIDYVNDGGGLIIEEPDSNYSFSPSFLTVDVTFTSNKMDIEDWPIVIVDPSSPLVKGLNSNELPGPMDCMHLDSAYTPITQGSKTRCYSMAILSSGSGRILLNMGNTSPSMELEHKPTISDAALCRMIGWVIKEID